jgi:hypothetical protein
LGKSRIDSGAEAVTGYSTDNSVGFRPGGRRVARARERHIIGRCQRCGAQHDIELPSRGSRDVAFRPVTELFRFCLGCERYVGRSCCWQPDAVTCADCATRSALTLKTLTSDAWLAGALPAVSQMQSALHQLEQMADSLAAGGPTNPPTGAGWISSWTSAGLLDARIRSARDHIAKRTWNAPADSTAAAADVDSKIQDLLASRDAALSRIRHLLMVHRRPRHHGAERPPIKRRWVAGTVLAVLLLAAGIGGVASGAWTRAIMSVSPAAHEVVDEPEVTGGPESDLAYPATPAATARYQLVSGDWNFDELRTGSLADQPSTTASGDGEVVPVPTAVDRSIRLPPGADPGVCVGRGRFTGTARAISIDVLVSPEVPASSELGIALAMSPGIARSVNIGLEGLRARTEDTWVHVRLAWTGSRFMEIEAAIRDGPGTFPPATLTAIPLASAEAALCIWREGDSEAGDILVDNVRLQN